MISMIDFKILYRGPTEAEEDVLQKRSNPSIYPGSTEAGSDGILMKRPSRFSPNHYYDAVNNVLVMQISRSYTGVLRKLERTSSKSDLVCIFLNLLRLFVRLT